MPKATTATARRRKVICRETTFNVPDEFERRRALMNLSTPMLKNLLRAAKLPIPKIKGDMAERLAAAGADVSVAVTTEAVVFGPPGKARPC
jgi:hypothetical protein